LLWTDFRQQLYSDHRFLVNLMQGSYQLFGKMMLQ